MSLLKPTLFFLLLAAGCGRTGGGGGGGGGDLQMPGDQQAFGATYTGDGTYYGADGSGNCSYEATPQNLMVAAMNNAQWENSAVCGMCVEVTGPKGPAHKIVVRIVDRCPECQSGDLDLSQEAFTQIADLAAGRVQISWQAVSCAVTGPLSYKFKAGSSQYWMGVQVRNSRLPIAKLEVQEGSGFLGLNQESYGYYILDTPDPGPGPFTFRVTAVTGQQVIESAIPLQANGVSVGTKQF